MADQLRKVYLTDRSDDGVLFGKLLAADGDWLYDVELAPHLTVLSHDGLSRFEAKPTEVSDG